MTTPENPSPQDPQPDATGAGAGDGESAVERVDPQDALRGLEDRPRIDEQGFPTAYTAVPPPLHQQAQGQGQDPGHGQSQGQQGRPGEGGPAQGQQGWRPPEPGQAGQSPQQPQPHYGQSPYGQSQPGQPQYGQPQPGYNGQPRYGQQEQQPQYNGRPHYDQPASQPTGAQTGYAQAGGQDPYHQQGYGYPPPPPGYNEPYGSPYGGGPVPGMPPYASWGQRVGAWLIDNLLAAVGISLLDASYYDWNSAARAVAWVVMVVGVVWALYNAFLAGRTGQSTGKRIVGIRLARYIDGQVVGPGYGVLRLFMNAVFWAICIIPGVLNYLWPLWDRKSQTWSDKIASSVVVRAR